MTRNRTLIALALSTALAAPLALLATSTDVALPMGPSRDQATTARMVHGLLSDSRYAYRPRALDDALSGEILTEYLKALDPGKVFFTAQDVAGFNKYATTLDDAIKSGQVDPAWAIFAVYRQRVEQRIAGTRALLKGTFDFTQDERYAYERKDAPWADAAALDTLWRQSVKNDWLRLKLAGKQPDEIRKTLDKRYANMLTGIQQLKGEEVFQSFMNAYAGSIDPHTDYMTPRSAQNFNVTMSNSLEGLGAVLFRQDDVVVIREVVPGGPAARSGRLKPGDRIVGVAQGDGEMKDVVGWRIDDVVALIGVPAQVVAVAAFQLLIAGVIRLLVGRNGVDVVRRRHHRHGNGLGAGSLQQLTHDVFGTLGAAGVDESIEGLDPLTSLLRILVR